MKKKSVTELVTTRLSKQNVIDITNLVGDDQQKFDELMHLFLGKDPEIARRAAWPLPYIVCDHPKLIRKYFPKLIVILKTSGLHPAMYRNIFSFLEVIDIPAKYSATIFDFAIKYTVNAALPVAIRAFAMMTAAKIVIVHPDLGEELRMIIHHLREETAPAIRSRSRRVLALLDKSAKT